MALGASIAVVARILLLIGVGVALRASGLLPRDASRPLNTLLVYVAIPALVFQAVQPAHLELAFLGVVGVAWVVALAGMALAWVVGRALRLPRPALGGFMLVAALGNTGYLGYPIVTSLFGHAGLVPAVFYDVFGTVGVLLTAGIAVCARFGDHDERVSLVREILTFPAMLALVAALALRWVTVPSLVSVGLDSLASMTVPLVMISVGLSLDLSKLRGHLKWAGPAAVVKLAVLPALAWVLASLFLRQPMLVRVSTLEAGMPSMMLALVFGTRFGLDDDFIASAIVLTTVAAVVTLPIVIVLVR
jgi:malate permease and related proteins